ncbi:hypothetical protein BU26DRAFT_499904 [Trematosphaeria pertusa]|uniref:Uncharacterized protein n=1 Tax=Trematosphaeria pertusa TaxID=390896 RepID=A0A6A6J3J9_9PLEO|nr:uncharacterized protein BU26DRAFT_499904 [Trematosphaeria pertusa]KAF2257405.1 hypothetical protein BU26DRAFT_499904 [Trematosphaeria pertusa]
MLEVLARAASSIRCGTQCLAGFRGTGGWSNSPTGRGKWYCRRARGRDGRVDTERSCTGAAAYDAIRGRPWRLVRIREHLLQIKSLLPAGSVLSRVGEVVAVVVKERRPVRKVCVNAAPTSPAHRFRQIMVSAVAIISASGRATSVVCRACVSGGRGGSTNKLTGCSGVL